jgi:DNA-binding NarL/FixJ family response regulator
MRQAKVAETMSEGTSTYSRILIIDKQPVFRVGLARLLSAEPDMEIIGMVGSCRDACTLAATLNPDVVILDLELEDTSGSHAIRKLRERFPKLRAIVYTDRREQSLVAEALRHDIRGFVLKESEPELLLAATRAIAAGGSYLDPAISAMVLIELNPLPRATDAVRLSRRESMTLRALAQGKSNKEIATKLGITERTVKFHVSAVMRRLDARNRTHAVRVAEEMGLLTQTQSSEAASNGNAAHAHRTSGKDQGDRTALGGKTGF